MWKVVTIFFLPLNYSSFSVTLTNLYVLRVYWMRWKFASLFSRLFFLHVFSPCHNRSHSNTWGDNFIGCRHWRSIFPIPPYRFFSNFDQIWLVCLRKRFVGREKKHIRVGTTRASKLYLQGYGVLLSLAFRLP